MKKIFLIITLLISMMSFGQDQYTWNAKLNRYGDKAVVELAVNECVNNFNFTTHYEGTYKTFDNLIDELSKYEEKIVEYNSRYISGNFTGLYRKESDKIGLGFDNNNWVMFIYENTDNNWKLHMKICHNTTYYRYIENEYTGITVTFTSFKQINEFIESFIENKDTLKSEYRRLKRAL